MSSCPRTYWCKGSGSKLPIAPTRRVGLLVTGTGRAARASGTRRRGTALIWASGVAINVRLLVSTAGRGATRVVRLFGVAGTRRAVLVGWAAAIGVPITVIELARRGAAPVVIPTRAVATRGTATVVVVIIGRRRVPTTSSWGPGAVPIATPVVGTCAIGSARLERRRRRRVADLLDASDFLTLELTTVELLDSGLEVGCGLIFDKADVY